MSAGRPSVPEGIGQKQQFQQMKAELKSHKAAEFSTDQNIFKIEWKAPNSIKTTYKLTQYKNGEENELPNAVLTLHKDEKLTFRLALPEPAWYKLNIFGTDQTDNNTSIPNIYTYLIDLTRAKDKALPYPKSYADFCGGMYLHKPKFLDTSSDLSSVKFKVEVPGAKRVAVKAGDEWTHLTDQGGNIWEGTACFSQYKGKDVPVNINASLGGDEMQFATLLQYKV